MLYDVTGINPFDEAHNITFYDLTEERATSEVFKLARLGFKVIITRKD